MWTWPASPCSWACRCGGHAPAAARPARPPARPPAHRPFPSPPTHPRPLQVFFLASWTAGPDPMAKFLWAFPLRALSGLAHLAVMYAVLPDRTQSPWTPSSFPAAYTALLFLLSNAHGVVCSVMFMAQMSFFTRLAALSPASGGSVMTLLNTLANLGSMLPAPLVLLGLDALTARACVGAEGACAGAAGAAACKAAGGACATTADGYPRMAALSTAYCVAWWLLMRGVVARLQAAPAESWK